MSAALHYLMIEPVNFGFNSATAVNNRFQQPAADNVQEQALSEFRNLVTLLRSYGVNIEVIRDSNEPYTPDSIFPNNWFSTHEDGSLWLYPMFAENRRTERKPSVLNSISKKFQVKQVHDLSEYEEKGLFLEGTGSMVLDRPNMKAYACISPRTAMPLLEKFCNRMGYTPVAFHAFDNAGHAIYHTNVMMCIGEQFAVICLDSIQDSAERDLITASLMDTGKTIIPISLSQMEQFAGNMLQIRSGFGETLLVMSSAAFSALDEEQRSVLSRFNKLVHAPLDTIESAGGGSARCMIAEIYLTYN